MTLQPQVPCERTTCPIVVIEAEMDRAGTVGSWSMLSGCLKLQMRGAKTTHVMKRNPQNAMRGRDGGGILDGPGNGGAALCVRESGSEISDAVVEHVQQAKQLQLVGGIAAFFGDGKASAYGDTRRLAFPAGEDQRQSQRGLKMHLLGPAASRIVDTHGTFLRPATTFSKHRHPQKNPHPTARQPPPHFHLPLDAEAPFQSRADIVETGKVRRAFRPGR